MLDMSGILRLIQFKYTCFKCIGVLLALLICNNNNNNNNNNVYSKYI